MLIIRLEMKSYFSFFFAPVTVLSESSLTQLWTVCVLWSDWNKSGVFIATPKLLCNRGSY